MNALALPILAPLVAAAASMLVWRSPRAQRLVGVAGAAALLGAGVYVLLDVWQHGAQVLAVGTWPPPFGVVLVADTLSAIMVLVTGIIGLAGAIHAMGGLSPRREALGFHPLYQMLLMGVAGAFLTGDIFNLYVWFEVLLISSFGLLVLGNDRAQIAGAIKYVLINLVSSVFLLAAVGLLYGATGTLNLADLAVRLPEQPPGLVTAIAMLLFGAFGLKAAVFPLFSWLPASYHTPPVAITAVFAGLLTKVGVYGLIRIFSLLFTEAPEFTHELLLLVAGATMLTGVLGAVAQDDIRRILAVHIVSQIGYLVLGLGLLSVAGLAAAIFYMVHVILVKANLFFISGEIQRATGSFHLDRCGGLYRARPLLAVAFGLSALSLAGFPPLSGFWAKLSVATAGLEQQRWGIIAIALLVGVLTAYSMTKIWVRAFWRPAERPLPADAKDAPRGVARAIPIAALTALSVALGLWPEPLLALAERAAAELSEPDRYVRAVLGVAR